MWPEPRPTSVPNGGHKGLYQQVIS